MAKTGHSGRHLQNVNKQVQAMITHKSQLPMPREITLPFKTEGHKTTAVLLPHELFSAIYYSYPEAWARVMCSGKETLQSWWAAVANHPQMRGHPIKSRPNWRSQAIPVGMHVDEVP